MSSRINYDVNFGMPDESEEYLISDWLSCIIDEFKEEENNIEWPIQVLDRESRKVLWRLTELLNDHADIHGIGGQACRIFERYVAVKCKNLVNSLLDDEYDDVVAQWHIFKHNFLQNILLHIVSSVQLASKMSHSGVQFSIKNVRNKLMTVGIRYSQAQIRESEYEVFRCLGFRLPVWSSLETAELFAKKVKLPCDHLIVVVSFAEISRNAIEEQVMDLVKVNSGTPALRTLHLSAACVAVCARIMTDDDKDIIEQLATLTKAPPLFIKCISDIIIKLATGDKDNNETDTDKTEEVAEGELTDDNSGDDDEQPEQIDDNSESDDIEDNSCDDDDDDEAEQAKDDNCEGHNENNDKEEIDESSDDGSDSG